jgi:hypothetical protein
MTTPPGRWLWGRLVGWQSGAHVRLHRAAALAEPGDRSPRPWPAWDRLHDGLADRQPADGLVFAAIHAEDTR